MKKYWYCTVPCRKVVVLAMHVQKRFGLYVRASSPSLSDRRWSHFLSLTRHGMDTRTSTSTCNGDTHSSNNNKRKESSSFIFTTPPPSTNHYYHYFVYYCPLLLHFLPLRLLSAAAFRFCLLSTAFRLFYYYVVVFVCITVL